MYIASEGLARLLFHLAVGCGYVLADESSAEFCRSVLQLGLPGSSEVRTRTHSNLSQVIRRGMLLAFQWRAWLSVRSLSSDRCLGCPMSR
jgi:hypothetical protein